MGPGPMGPRILQVFEKNNQTNAPAATSGQRKSIENPRKDFLFQKTCRIRGPMGPGPIRDPTGVWGRSPQPHRSHENAHIGEQPTKI